MNVNEVDKIEKIHGFGITEVWYAHSCQSCMKRTNHYVDENTKCKVATVDLKTTRVPSNPEATHPSVNLRCWLSTVAMLPFSTE